MRVAVLAVLAFVLTGCGAQLGLNFQRSSLRAAGDMGSTTTLEIAKMKHVEHERATLDGVSFLLQKLH